MPGFRTGEAFLEYTYGCYILLDNYAWEQFDLIDSCWGDGDVQPLGMKDVLAINRISKDLTSNKQHFQVGREISIHIIFPKLVHEYK